MVSSSSFIFSSPAEEGQLPVLDAGVGALHSQGGWVGLDGLGGVPSSFTILGQRKGYTPPGPLCPELLAFTPCIPEEEAAMALSRHTASSLRSFPWSLSPAGYINRGSAC